MDEISRAFAALTPNEAGQTSGRLRLLAQMELPAPRPYHNAVHIAHVLHCLFAWSDAKPAAALLAAALYHDAVYDAARKDNEAQSAAFCRAELRTLGLCEPDINEAVRLIEATVKHDTPAAQTKGEVLLLDADLFVFGGTPADYANYVRAVRAEYAHVSDADWQTGRPAVLRRFLQREKIYGGDWDGCAAREKAARENIAGEVSRLEGQTT